MLDRMLLASASDEKLFIEDVFSSYLYTGNGSTQTITNGIDLAGKGGMVWTKARSAAYPGLVTDTSRGLGYYLSTNETSSQSLVANGVTSASNSGYSLGSNTAWNGTGTTFASWTFRKAPKFFDVVTYTGNGANRNIAHSLGVAPGCIIIKETSSVLNYDWQVYHRGMGASGSMQLNKTNADGGSGFFLWNNTAPTETSFTLGSSSNVNHSGATYVAYLYAHDATADGVIQCGSFTTGATYTPVTVDLGWEPQFVLLKTASTTGSWGLCDNMRGMPVGGNTSGLYANTSEAEQSISGPSPTATGFTFNFGALNATYIYVAIRRGPMKTPTLGTSVFSPNLATSGAPWFKSGFPVDFGIFADKTNGGDKYTGSRLTGGNFLVTNSTAAQGDDASFMKWDYMNGWRSDSTANSNYIGYSFRRAPGFMDVVCYTGTGATTRTVNHNLGVAPELMIIKLRSGSTGWLVYNAPRGPVYYLSLNRELKEESFIGLWRNTYPTSTVFTLGTSGDVNNSGSTYVAYLFASCPGVSKVGSYTGNGSSQTINCGFAAGARFVLIKRTNSTGDWYVWDTARGIVAGNDPHLSLNTASAEVTTDDTIDTDSSGFVVNQVAATNVNVSSATYIYLAIA